MDNSKQNPNNKFYPDGMFFFPAHPNSPDWAKGKVILYEGFIDWLKQAFEDGELTTVYNGKKQIQLECNQKQDNPNGGYAKVSTYQKDAKQQTQNVSVPQSSEDDDIFG
jgi:hypothetical protein